MRGVVVVEEAGDEVVVVVVAVVVDSHGVAGEEVFPGLRAEVVVSLVHQAEVGFRVLPEVVAEDFHVPPAGAVCRVHQAEEGTSPVRLAAEALDRLNDPLAVDRTWEEVVSHRAHRNVHLAAIVLRWAVVRPIFRR